MIEIPFLSRQGRWLVLLPLLPIAANAADSAKAAPPQSLDQVVVIGNRNSDTDERRYSTAAKMVFGRDELSRYGDTSVADVLKRLPGITLSGTPGRGGDIRMRGLGNGYTLILINGEPAPRGFAIDSLTPEQIERIEIMRAPVAEFGARGIAGTINIVLREKFVKKDSELRLSAGLENGKLQPSLHVGKSDGDADFNYNIHVSPGRRNQETDGTTVTRGVAPVSGIADLLQTQHDDSWTSSDNVHVSGRLNWKLGPADTLAINPFAMLAQSDTLGRSHLEQSLGTALPPFADADWHTRSNTSLLRLMGNARHTFSPGSILDTRVNAGFADSDSKLWRHQYDSAGNSAGISSTDDRIRDDNLSLAAKHSMPLAPGHNFAYGIEAEQGERRETGHTVENGVQQLSAYGATIKANTRRLAGYAQDEWDISPLWSTYAGLRWESVRIHSDWQQQSADTRSGVLSPLLHSVWRFSEESRDQIRLGVTRSYKAPTLGQLVPKPTLAAAYPSSGPNTSTSPDSAGNPLLKPELAWGLDLAYEHYLPAGGMLGASAFWRSIDDLIRNVTSLQTVSYSSYQRWLTTAQNVGRARTAGIELEAKFRLSELVAEAPPVDLRANLSRFLTHVDGVPGPDNRLDQQPKLTANAGFDWRLRRLPLTVGANLNWTPAYTVRQTNSQYFSQGNKKQVDLYGLWKFDPNRQLRISAANLLHGDYQTDSRYADATSDQTAVTTTRTYWNLAARLEIKF